MQEKGGRGCVELIMPENTPINFSFLSFSSKINCPEQFRPFYLKLSKKIPLFFVTKASVLMADSSHQNNYTKESPFKASVLMADKSSLIFWPGTDKRDNWKQQKSICDKVCGHKEQLSYRLRHSNRHDKAMLPLLSQLLLRQHQPFPAILFKNIHFSRI